jgi:peptide/nickel transport system permease protein
MSTVADQPTAVVASDEPPPTQPVGLGRERHLLRTLRTAMRPLRQPLVAFAAVWLFIVVGAAIFAPLVATHDPLAQDLQAVFAGPSAKHWFGTDTLGRDIFSRMVYGGKTTLEASLEAVGISLVLGVPLGLLAGYIGGKWETASNAVFDSVLAVPGLILAVTIIAALGPSLFHAMLGVGIVFSPRVFRVTKAATRDVRSELFIEASHAIGCSRTRIVMKHVLPHVVSPLIVVVSLTLGTAVLAESGLSFLGLGIAAPAPSWGRMLLDAQQRTDLPYLIWIPGLALFFTIASFTFMGEAIREAIGARRKTDDG